MLEKKTAIVTGASGVSAPVWLRASSRRDTTLSQHRETLVDRSRPPRACFSPIRPPAPSHASRCNADSNLPAFYPRCRLVPRALIR